MRFDFSDLRLFEAVVRTGSISAGAEASHLALPSASARISGMESALGTKLLQRGRRGVTPTAAGRALLHHARLIIAQIETMRGDLSSFGRGLKGEIKLLANTAALVEVMPAALCAFLEANPEIDVDIEERTSVEIVMAVSEGHAEFGLIASSADDHGLEIRPLGVDRLTAIVAAGSPLAARKTVSFAELLEERFISLTTGALPAHLASNAARLGKRINDRVRLRSFSAIARLVEAGVGVSVVPLAAAERYRTSGVATIKLVDDWADRRLLLCARSFSAMSRPARSLVAEIQLASASILPGLQPADSQ